MVLTCCEAQRSLGPRGLRGQGLGSLRALHQHGRGQGSGVRPTAPGVPVEALPLTLSLVKLVNTQAFRQEAAH